MTDTDLAAGPVYSFLGHPMPVQMAVRVADRVPLCDERDGTLVVRRRTHHLVPARAASMPGTVALGLIEEAPDPQTADRYVAEAYAAGVRRADIQKAWRVASRRWQVQRDYVLRAVS